MKKFAMFAISAALAACGSTTSTSGGGADVGVDATVQDASAADTAVQDVAVADVAKTDAAPAKDYGFTVRKPQDHKVTCKDGSTLQQPDVDWICTFSHKEAKGFLYVQSNPDTCSNGGMSNLPAFKAVGAWMSLPSGVVDVKGALYDWGGNHHNDSLQFDFDGKHFEAYHSSLGFGWRKCQNIDCLRVLDAAGGAVLEDGCTKERTLPIVCSLVEADGTYAPLVDAFKPCAGDPNYP